MKMYQRSGGWRWPRATHLIAACAAAATLSLAGCGGGGDSAATFNVGVFVDGVAFPDQILAGSDVTVVAQVGQSIELDATEPVQWSFSVNGSPLFTDGTTVLVGGLAITQVQVSPTKVVLTSSLNGPTVLPVDVTLVATSTIDAALVTTVHIELQ